jgi:hypothetical protein
MIVCTINTSKSRIMRSRSAFSQQVLQIASEKVTNKAGQSPVFLVIFLMKHDIIGGMHPNSKPTPIPGFRSPQPESNIVGHFMPTLLIRANLTVAAEQKQQSLAALSKLIVQLVPKEEV